MRYVLAMLAVVLSGCGLELLDMTDMVGPSCDDADYVLDDRGTCVFRAKDASYGPEDVDRTLGYFFDGLLKFANVDMRDTSSECLASANFSLRFFDEDLYDREGSHEIYGDTAWMPGKPACEGRISVRLRTPDVAGYPEMRGMEFTSLAHEMLHVAQWYTGFYHTDDPHGYPRGWFHSTDPLAARYEALESTLEYYVICREEERVMGHSILGCQPYTGE